MDEWIKRIRSKIGSELMFVNSAVAWIEDDDGKVLMQKRSGTRASIQGLPGGHHRESRASPPRRPSFGK